MTVAIDITKSNPYRENTELEFDGNGNLANKWLLGYKKDAEKDDDDSFPDIHFQWASVQIVGLDVPLVLDAVPIHRGFSRAAIVDTLLGSATEMVDVELVLMDREFSGTQVKNVCEEHGVHYLVPGQMRSSERAMCTRLRRQEKLVHIQRETGSGSKGEQRTTLSDFVGDQEADEEGEG